MSGRSKRGIVFSAKFSHSEFELPNNANRERSSTPSMPIQIKAQIHCANMLQQINQHQKVLGTCLSLKGVEVEKTDTKNDGPIVAFVHGCEKEVRRPSIPSIPIISLH